MKFGVAEKLHYTATCIVKTLEERIAVLDDPREPGEAFEA